MRPKSIVDWAEVISALAVVITLFYVGYQVKQNTETVRTTVLNDISTDLNRLFTAGMDESMATLITKADDSTDALTQVDKERLFNHYGLFISVFEATWRHREAGRITEEYFDTMVPILCKTHGSPMGLDFWFEWKEAITQGYWYEITKRCNFAKPDIKESWYPAPK